MQTGPPSGFFLVFFFGFGLAGYERTRGFGGLKVTVISDGTGSVLLVGQYNYGVQVHRVPKDRGWMGIGGGRVGPELTSAST